MSRKTSYSLLEQRSRRKQQLIDAEFNLGCWYCGLPFFTDKGKLHATLEHIVPITRGGDESKINTVLAHMVCNVKADTKLFCEKVNMRARLRRAISSRQSQK